MSITFTLKTCDHGNDHKLWNHPFAWYLQVFQEHEAMSLATFLGTILSLMGDQWWPFTTTPPDLNIIQLSIQPPLHHHYTSPGWAALWAVGALPAFPGRQDIKVLLCLGFFTNGVPRAGWIMGPRKVYETPQGALVPLPLPYGPKESIRDTGALRRYPCHTPGSWCICFQLLRSVNSQVFLNELLPWEFKKILTQCYWHSKKLGPIQKPFINKLTWQFKTTIFQ